MSYDHVKKISLVIANNKTTNPCLMIINGNKISIQDGKPITTEYREAVISYAKYVLECYHDPNRHSDYRPQHYSAQVSASKRVGRTKTYLYYSIEKNVYDKDIVVMKITDKFLGAHGYNNEVLELI